MKKRVLFICVHNSARSQMAEAWLNTICGEYFEAQSAGLEPGTLNPLAVQVMAEAGIDISKKKTQAVFDVFTSGQLFAYVITVCDETSAEKCPIFPGPATRLHWSFAIHHKLRGAKPPDLNKFGSFVTRFARRSKSGARKSANRLRLLRFNRDKRASRQFTTGRRERLPPQSQLAKSLPPLEWQRGRTLL